MSLEITEQVREGVVILTLKGRLTVGESASVHEKVSKVLASGCANLILDLSAVDYIDSMGLGSLVYCFTSVKKAGGALRLLRLSKRNVELLLLTKLHNVFEVFAEEEDAVNSFFPDRVVKRLDILNLVQQQEI
jgi:anti-sigma B factor antagonist